MYPLGTISAVFFPQKECTAILTTTYLFSKYSRSIQGQSISFQYLALINTMFISSNCCFLSFFEWALDTVWGPV